MKSITLLLGVLLSLGFAPAPVPKPRPAAPNNTPATIITALEENGMIEFSNGDRLFVASIEGNNVKKPVLKRKDRNGKVQWVSMGIEGEITMRADQKAAQLTVRRGSMMHADGTRSSFDESVISLSPPAER